MIGLLGGWARQGNEKCHLYRFKGTSGVVGTGGIGVLHWADHDDAVICFAQDDGVWDGFRGDKGTVG